MDTHRRTLTISHLAEWRPSGCRFRHPGCSRSLLVAVLGAAHLSTFVRTPCVRPPIESRACWPAQWPQCPVAPSAGENMEETPGGSLRDGTATASFPAKLQRISSSVGGGGVTTLAPPPAGGPLIQSTPPPAPRPAAPVPPAVPQSTSLQPVHVTCEVRVGAKRMLACEPLRGGGGCLGDLRCDATFLLPRQLSPQQANALSLLVPHQPLAVFLLQPIVQGCCVC